MINFPNLLLFFKCLRRHIYLLKVAFFLICYASFFSFQNPVNTPVTLTMDSPTVTSIHVSQNVPRNSPMDVTLKSPTANTIHCSQVSSSTIFNNNCDNAYMYVVKNARFYQIISERTSVLSPDLYHGG